MTVKCCGNNCELPLSGVVIGVPRYSYAYFTILMHNNNKKQNEKYGAVEVKEKKKEKFALNQYATTSNNKKVKR